MEMTGQTPGSRESMRFKILVVEERSGRISSSLNDQRALFDICTLHSCETALEYLAHHPAHLCLIDLTYLRNAPDPTALGMLLEQLSRESVPYINLEEHVSESVFLWPLHQESLTELMGYSDLGKPVFMRTIRHLLQARQMIERLNSQEKALRDSHRLSASFVDSLPSALIITDTDGYIVYVNDQANAMIGTPDEFLLGGHLGVFIDGDDKTVLEFVYQDEAHLLEVTPFEGAWFGEEAIFMHLEVVPETTNLTSVIDYRRHMVSMARRVDLKTWAGA